MESSRTPMLTSILAVAMMVATAAGASPRDQSGVVERRANASGFVYSGDGVHVLTGPTDLSDGCVGVGFTEPTATFISPPSGSQLHHFTVREGVAVFADEGIGDVFEWLDYACGALLDSDPTTVAPEPLAVGSGKISFHLRMDANEVVHVRNGVTGKVTTADGRRVHISAFAAFTEDASGLDVKQLRVNYGG